MNTVTGCIYKIVNTITNKVYIGQTIQPLNQRWAGHCSEARLGTLTNSKFHNAIRKYGSESWSKEVVVDNVPVDLLNDLEISVIVAEDSISNGYNTVEGGKATRGYKHTAEAKAKMSTSRRGKNCGALNSMFGKTFTQEHRDKISKGVLASNRDCRKSEAHKQKIRDSLVGKFTGVKSNTFVPWYYITPEGKYVEVYDMTKRDYAIQHNVPESKFLSIFIAKRMDRKIVRGEFAGWTFGNLKNEVYNDVRRAK